MVHSLEWIFKKGFIADWRFIDMACMWIQVEHVKVSVADVQKNGGGGGGGEKYWIVLLDM